MFPRFLTLEDVQQSHEEVRALEQQLLQALTPIGPVLLHCKPPHQGFQGWHLTSLINGPWLHAMLD